MYRHELEGLSREELIAQAEKLGVPRPRVLTQPELIDEIIGRTVRNERDRARARGWLGRARDLLAKVVERGLHLPDAARALRATPVSRSWPSPPPPLPTVTLAEIYAAQGHLERAISVLEEVLSREPDHQEARVLRDRFIDQAQRTRARPARPAEDRAPSTEGEPPGEPRAAKPAVAAEALEAQVVAPEVSAGSSAETITTEEPAQPIEEAAGTEASYSPAMEVTTIDSNENAPAASNGAEGMSEAVQADAEPEAVQAAAEPAAKLESAPDSDSDSVSAPASASASASAPASAPAPVSAPASASASASAPASAPAPASASASAPASAPAPAPESAPIAASAPATSDELTEEALAPAEPEEAAALPDHYDVDEVVAIAVDPHTLFIYWEVRPVTLARAQAKRPAGKLALRILAVTPSWDGPVTKTWDVPVDALFGDRFIRDTPPGANVRVSVGWLEATSFEPFAVGLEVASPRALPTESSSDEVGHWTPDPVQALRARRSAGQVGRTSDVYRRMNYENNQITAAQGGFADSSPGGSAGGGIHSAGLAPGHAPSWMDPAAQRAAAPSFGRGGASELSGGGASELSRRYR